jgi:hypothetical protein
MSTNTSPSLNFCSFSSKAKAEAIQQMQGNTSIDTCLDLPNKLTWSYLAVPTYLMEHILEWMYARQYLWVRLAINVGGESFLKKKIQNSSEHIL